MSAIELSRAQRAALCDLLDEVGPEAPTLCDGWTTHELAAHLVVREGRPDTSLGFVGGPLAAWTEKVQSDAASQDYGKLVKLIRKGPPIWSAFRLPWVDGQLNTLEHFVHIEDVRRAAPDWQPRELDQALRDFMWDRLKLAGRTWFSGVSGGVTLVRSDGETATHKVKGGKPMVTVTGDVGELVMVAFGRKEAVVAVEGEPEAVASFRERKFPEGEDHLHPEAP